MSKQFPGLFGRRQLPIFPLEAALMPNELMPLHIFEPRYRQLIADIELSDNLFGLSYSYDSPRPRIDAVGCAALVRERQMLDDGRSNILTIGVKRYRLVDWVETDAPYFMGEVEFFGDDPEPESELKPLADRVFALFRRIAEAAHELSGERGRLPEIAQAEPEDLSFLVTAAFNLDAVVKYRMLETRSTIERLGMVLDILRPAAEKIEADAEIHKRSQTNGHSKKKIDF